MNWINDRETLKFLKDAIKEDIGKSDITTLAIIPKKKKAKMALLAKEDLVVCGISLAASVFKIKDKSIKFLPLVKDGQSVKKGKIIARVEGRAQSLLAAERVALNLISLLSGIATKTRDYVYAVKPYKVKIIDTRKTIPGLRLLEKYAVRIGGGYNHRFSLDEMVMIKDNHLKVIGKKLWCMVDKIKDLSKHYKIEIEVNTLEEFNYALKLKPDIIMLDNMSISDMRNAVKIRNHLRPKTYHPLPKLEASGGITLKNIRDIASIGIEMISIGALTHSVNSVDISLEAV